MKQALAGVRVLDLTQVMAGPYCSMLLGDMGADVIKVESPAGDASRRMAGSVGTESPSFWAINRNKRGVSLNLKDPLARDAFLKLVKTADILVENYRAGVMDRLGLGYDRLHEVNPALVYLSISGFGQTGPYGRRGGFDLVAQGMSGIMSITGDEGLAPMKSGIPITDLGAGLLGLQAVLGAYIHRLRTGEGQRIDASLMEAGVALSVWESAQYFSGRGIPGPMGSAHRMSAPYQAIRCADGYINLGAANQRSWERFARLIAREDLLDRPEFKDDTGRVQNRHQLAAEIETVTSTKPRAHWLQALDEAGVPAGPIQNYEEVFNDPQIVARGVVREIDHPVGGHIRVVGPVVKMSQTPSAITRPSPLLGEHTFELLREAGVSDEDLERMRREGNAIGPDPKQEEAAR